MSRPYRFHMTVHRASRAHAELNKLVQGRPHLPLHPPKRLLASALLASGANPPAHPPLAWSRTRLLQRQNPSAWYEQPDYPLPMTGQRITHNHVAAFAAITFFEGQVRPLARTRLRRIAQPSSTND